MLDTEAVCLGMQQKQASRMCRDFGLISGNTLACSAQPPCVPGSNADCVLGSAACSVTAGRGSQNTFCVCRADIVGQKTFGKGVVQYYFPMTDGSGIKLTIAKYLTPGHFDITQSGGLSPDHACSDYPHGDRVTPENDICIQDALKLIGQQGSE